MKRIFAAFLFASLVLSMQAQKFAFVDTDYILKKIPLYEAAQKKLDALSKKYEAEIEVGYQEVDKLYKAFQTEKVFLSDEMKLKREEEIIAKENEVKQLQKKYFSRDGELYKKRTELIQPIQDEILKNVKELAAEGDFALILDTASGNASVLFADAKYDKSDDILKKMGYGK